TYVLPTLIELDSISELQGEVFGPVLHVVRFARDRLPTLMEEVAATGYGLTMGLHTRIDETIRQVSARAHVGNLYINRNMVGAVVGVQPFGGEGLSGTGPKAGGPLYMHRLLRTRAVEALGDVVTQALPGAVAAGGAPGLPRAFTALTSWLDGSSEVQLLARCHRLARALGEQTAWALTGPTGERNVYALLPREATLCLADNEQALLLQLGAVLLVGSRAVWPLQPITQALRARLPAEVQTHIDLSADWSAPGAAFSVALFQGSDTALREAACRLAERDGPIVNLHRFTLHDQEQPLEALLLERAVSTNTAAAEGNASLMTIA
ncbi:MAG: aldehyde dehydrogenase family protein, partial [Comamonadaceae bacterium]